MALGCVTVLAPRVAHVPFRRYGRIMSRTLWILVLVVGCGEPVLRNAPKPNPGAVAGVAAAAAAAVTLASPQTAAQRQEQRQQGEPDNRGVTVKESVPADVLDRLDQHTQDAGIDGAAATQMQAPSAPAASAPAPSAPASAAKPKPAAHRPVIPPPSEYAPRQ
jgi:hypothetical protein